MPVSPALARIYASAPSDSGFVETLALAHPFFSRTHYICPRPFPYAATLETGAPVIFLPLPFAVQLPGQSGEGQQDLILAIDNVDQQIIGELESASQNPTHPVTATYRVYVESDPAAPAFVLPALAVHDISVTHSAANGTAGRTDTLNRPFPSQLYTVALFPGLDR